MELAMNRRLTISRLCLFAALANWIFAAGTLADENENTDAANAEKARLVRAARHMELCDMRLASDAEKAVELVQRPLLTFGDSARDNKNGTLWAFGKSGRPLALLELYKGTKQTDRWVHAVSLTGKAPVVMKTPLGGQWKPEKIQIEPQPVTGSAEPEAKEAQRLRQLREIARRFTAHEFWDPDNSRFELRLLVQPVHRYNDSKEGIHDAAAFVLAHGTNPEIILLVEAIGKELKASRWHYSIARLGSAEIHVELDGKEVWKCGRAPAVVGSPSDPYWLFFATSTDGE